jgi:quercetin dioxygenase-like cupin family protein
MKRLSQLAAGLLLPPLSLMVFCQPAIAQDSAKVAPRNVKVLLENQRVRVLEVRIKPGEKIPMHSHPAHLVYTFSPVKGKYSSPDGETKVSEARRGTIQWSGPITHASENVGTDDIHALVIELKDPPPKRTKLR